jgi:hypothetical protein
MNKISIYIIVISMFIIRFDVLGQGCGILPSQLPSNPLEIDQVNKIIACTFAPKIEQLARTNFVNSANGRADLITKIFYDSDSNMGNNWESLDSYANVVTKDYDALDPIIYYSVVWTNVAWVISYDFYHPRDYAGNTSTCLPDNHENDFEGAIFVVSRIDMPSLSIIKNQLIGGYTISHEDLLPFTDINTTPIVSIDNGSHSVELNVPVDGCISTAINPCDDCDPLFIKPITYTKSNDDQCYVAAINIPFVLNGINIIEGVLFGNGLYQLEDIFGSQSNSLFNLKSYPLVFNGDKFYTDNLPCFSNFLGRAGIASAPWGWSQFNYSNTLIHDKICSAFHFAFPKFFNCDLIIPNFIVEYNPYDRNKCINSPYVININQDQDWNFNPNYVISKIVIKPNITLTIKNRSIIMDGNGTIELNEGSSLIIDNSEIIGCKHGPKWYGITTVGTSNKVHLINQSRIWDALKGISITSRSKVPNPSLKSPDLLISQSSFDNCDIGIYLDHNKGNARMINNSFMINCDIGIKCNKANGFLVDNSRFYGNVVSIDAFDSKITVLSNNKFEWGPYSSSKNTSSGGFIYLNDRGIVLKGSYPGSSGSTIGVSTNNAVNEFKNLTLGILASGNESPIGATVNNCNFDNLPVAAVFSGANSYHFDNNNVGYGQVGSWSWKTGSNFNTNSCNLFTQTYDYNIKFEYNNSKTTFIGNNFASSVFGKDILLENATIASSIGREDNPAGNCFTPSADIVTNNSATFSYFFYDGPDKKICEEPVSMGNYFKNRTLIPQNNCSKIGIFRLIGPKRDGTEEFIPNSDSLDFSTHISKDEIRIKIEEGIIKVHNTGGDDPQTLIDESLLTSNSNRFYNENVLDEWINYALYRSIEENDFSFGESILNNLHDWKWQKQLFGLKLRQNRIDEATTLLESMPSRNEDEQFFKEVQSINLKRLKFEENMYWNITVSDLNRLENIALSIQPSSGYARSLYEYLTGKAIPIPILNSEQNNKMDVSSRNDINSNSNSIDLIKIYPNPANDKLNIVSKGIDILSITITDLSGRSTKYNNILKKEYSINLEKYNTGFYNITIIDITGIVSNKKFLKN